MLYIGKLKSQSLTKIQCSTSLFLLFGDRKDKDLSVRSSQFSSVVRNSSFIRFFIMNTKTSFSYSLIALALWSNYSFGVITQIGNTNTIIAGTATNWNANNTLVLGNAGVVGGTHRIVIGEGDHHYWDYGIAIGRNAGQESYGGKYIFTFGDTAGYNSSGNSEYNFIFGGNLSGRRTHGKYNFTFGSNAGDVTLETITLLMENKLVIN